MLLIPSIDIKDGKCVRLRQGRMDEVTVFDDDPRDAARRWVDAGARRLHLVDLDGAVEGGPRNAEVIRALVSEFPDVDVQVGGGIRDDDTIEGYLATGARYVILGTRAVTTPGFVADACVEFPGHIIVGLDARDGRAAVDGWSKLTRFHVDDLARRVEDCGVEAIIHTDIGRDGMLEGVNVEATERLARDLNVPVFASGGVRDLDDIRALCAAADAGIAGAIVGRALYEGTLDLAAAARPRERARGRVLGPLAGLPVPPPCPRPPPLSPLNLRPSTGRSRCVRTAQVRMTRIGGGPIRHRAGFARRMPAPGREG